MKFLYKHTIRTACFLMGLFVVIASTVLPSECSGQDFKSEKDLAKRAEKFFQNEDYITAEPLFSQLRSTHPNDVNYDYKFSVSNLYAKKDKEKALSYLKRVAANPNCDKKVFYYLGRAYHLNYRFSEAIRAYQKFKRLYGKKGAKEFQVDRQIEMCNNGLELLRDKTPLIVLKKTEIKEREYFRSYDMEMFQGNLVVKPDDFKSKTDKEKEEYSIIFVGKKVPVIYYSSYGVNGDNKDIYKIEKRYDGSFGSPSRLSDVINTPYDEDFPFMHPDGKTLYFCSKGHNSMGGYDIFKTTYDSITDSWTEPVNLDFPINSADDDIFYLATDDEMVANFSSRRTSIKGMITVYKVKLEHKPGVREILAVREESIPGEEPALLALEEIKEVVQLNVDATEEELAILTGSPVTVAIGSDIAERERAPDLMETKSAEIAALSDLTNEQIINIAYENAQILDDKAKKLKQEAEITSSIADKKHELATVKAEKAEDILATIKNVKDEDQKQIEMQRAEELKTESEQLEREAEVADDLAVLLESNADKKQKDAETALSKSRQIESAVAENSIEESIVMLVEQKMLVESSDEQSIGAEGALSNIEQRVEQKRVEADESYEKIQYIENEIAEIKDEVKSLKREADNSKDVRINEEQLRQLEEELKESEKELAVTFEKAEHLETEAKTLQKKADVIYEVTREIEESTPEVEVALAAPPEIKTVREELSIEEPATSVRQSEISAQQDEVDIVEEVALATKLEEQSGGHAEETELIREETGTIDDPYFKERALQEGEELEEVAEAKQVEAAESQAAINKFEFEENQSQLAQISDASASFSMKSEEIAYVQELEAEAQTLYSAARDIKENANSIEDSETKIVELQKANDLEIMAIEKQREAIEIYKQPTPDPALNALSAERASTQETSITSVEKVEEEEYPAHLDSLPFSGKGGYASWPESGPPLAIGREEDQGEAIDVEDEIALATKLEEQSENYAEEAESIREKASTLDDPYFKERALQEADKLEQAAQKKQEEANVHYEKVLEFEQSEQAGRESYEIEDSTPTDGARISQGKQLEAEKTEEKEQGEDQVITPAYADALPAGPETLDESPEDLNRSRQGSAGREEAMSSKEDENYTALINESEEIMQTAITEHEKSEELRMEAEYQRNTAQRLLGSLDTITDPVVFQETFNEAEELEQLSMINAEKADSLDQIAENTEIAAISKIHEAESYLQELEESSPPPSEGVAPFGGRSPSIPTQSVEERQRTETSTLPDYQGSEIAMTNEIIEPEPVFLATKTYPGTAASSSASILEYDVFETLPVSVYSKSNPIPINKKLPRGVVFKVQIGAFRNPIPQDLFKGISPLMGEKTSMGFIRYTAGMFKEFQSANKAKNTIRGLGYRDAFVVAFNNGKRVTPNQAMAMLGEKPIESGLLTKDTWSGTGEMAFANIPGTTPASPTDLSSIKGLLYTVQIGVYSKPVTSAQLHNVNPVYGTTTSEGYIRYTHGIYGDLITAISARKDIVDKGIMDAFVTAYYNGKRISIGRAKTLEISGLAGREEQPYSGGSEGVSLRFIPPPEADRPLTEEGAVVYKVQIGAFKDEVPVEIASIYLDLVNMGIDQYRDENSFTIYTAGSFIDRESAEELKDVIVSKGIKDAFVKEYSGGQKTPDYRENRPAVGDSRQAAGSGQTDMAQAERLMREAEEKTIAEAAAKERVEEEKRARVEEERRTRAEEENKARAENEAERLVSEIQDAYTSVETLEKSAKDNMKRATALLSDVSIELEDDVKEREMQKAEELVQRAIVQHQQAKNTFELAQELEASARDKMLISGFSENQADDYLRTIVSFDHNKGLITRMSEAEAGVLQQEVSDAYNHAEELQNNTRDNITQAHDVLYNSETINDEIKQLVHQALGDVEKTKDAYDQAKNTLYAARYKMILGGYIKEYIDDYLRVVSAYDNNLIVRMPESEAAGLQQEIKSAYLRVATSENVARGKIGASQMLCDTINSDSNIGKKEEEISRAAELMQAAITEHQGAKDALEMAQTLEPVAQYKMLLGGYSKEEADDYLSAITPASYDTGLLDSLPETEAARLQQEVNDAYTKANEFQNNVSVQLEEAHSVLYAIEIIDERTKQLVEGALEGVENAEYRYEQTEFKLYDAKCKMILGSYSKEDVNNRLIAASEFDKNLIQRIPGYEVEVLQAKTRDIYNEVARMEDSAQRKLDESQNILDNAETIQYPDVKKQEVERAGEIKLQAMLELQEAAAEREKAKNTFEISKYKILLGGITEDDADYQRLEYIPQ